MSISTLSKEKVTIKQAISDFFLSCKVEGKSSETAVCQDLKMANVQLWCQFSFDGGPQCTIHRTFSLSFNLT